MNILAPEADLVSLLDEQKTDMDFLSLENSSVSSFFISCLITYKQAAEEKRTLFRESSRKQKQESYESSLLMAES